MELGQQKSAQLAHWRLPAVLLSAVLLICSASAQSLANEGRLLASGVDCGPSLSCLNGGVCNVTPGSDAGQGYLCACPDGFGGEDCATMCGAAGEPTCEEVNEGATEASATTPAPTAADPAVSSADPVVNTAPATNQACGPHLVCQNGGVCNQTPGSEAGQGYLCACLDGFVGLDCSVASSVSTSTSTATTQSSQVTPVVLSPSVVTAPGGKKSSGGAKTGVIVGCIIAAIAVLALIVGGVMFAMRKRRTSGSSGALAYQEREKVHAQMSSFDGRDQEGV